tara:strand:+ start:7117 stop:7548 length:432 start_codon:yes stop_codon:yes gene_type:complete
MIAPALLVDVAAVIESHEATRIPLGVVDASLRALNKLRAAGLLRLEGGEVGLTPRGWRAVVESTRTIGRLEAYVQGRRDVRSVGLRVARALDSLGPGWHDTKTIQTRGCVSDKSARDWLRRLHRARKIDHKEGRHGASTWRRT